MNCLYNKLKKVSIADLHKLIKFLNKDEDLTNESLTILDYIISKDIDILANVFSSNELEICILANAIHNNEYAGYEYNANELLNSEHDDFEESDSGLAWVCYNDIWNFLYKIDSCIIEQPTIIFPE